MEREEGLRLRHSKSGFALLDAISVVGLLAVSLVSIHLSNHASSYWNDSTPLSLEFDEPTYFVAGAADERPPMVALASNNVLVLFDSDNPGAATSQRITGLQFGEVVLAIDTDTSTNTLYGVTSQNRIVRITPSTGVAVQSARMKQGVNDAELQAVATMYNFYIDSGGLYENSFNAGEKWVRSDVVNSFRNFWFYILPNGDLFEWNGGNTLTTTAPLARLGVNAHHNPELLIGASTVTLTNPQGALAADNLRHFYRSSTGNFHYNLFGGRERWFKGEVLRKSDTGRNNPWYYVLPNGNVHEYDSTIDRLSGAFVGNFGVGVWRNPALLYDANQVNTVSSNGFDERFKFFFDRTGFSVRNLFEEATPAFDLKWFVGLHNRYYFLRPNGDLVQWDGGDGTGFTLTNLGPNAWDNVEQIVNDYKALITDEARQLDCDRGFYRFSEDQDFFYNSSGLAEKWIVGNPLDKTTGRTNPWYIIFPNGQLIEWDGRRDTVAGTTVGVFPQAYANPGWLCDAYADGTVLNNAVGDSYAPADTTALGDRLNDGLLDPSKGIGADIDPDTGDMFIVTGNFQSLQVNVRTGETIVNTDIDSGFQLAGIAFSNTGDAYTIDEFDEDDGLQELNIETGLPESIGFFGVNSSTNMGLEIIGTGVPGGGDTLAVLTVNGVSGLYQIDMSNGAATLIGVIRASGASFNNLNDVTINCEANGN